MASVNKVILIGNLTKDPDQRFMSNGDCVTNVTVATSEKWKAQNGEKKEKAEFHRVTFYRKLAEIAGEYLKKGRPVYIEGRLETRKYTDKNGVERYATDIIASDMKMLGNRGVGSSEGDDNHMQQPNSGKSPASSGFEDLEDDLPF